MFADSDVCFSTPAIGLIALLLGGVISALIFIFKLLMDAKNSQIVDLKSSWAADVKEWKERSDSYQKLAERKIQSQEEVAAKVLADRGLVGLPALAPVPASHNSPVSEAQKFSAEFESLKARQVAAELAVVLAVGGDDTPAVTPVVPTPVMIVAVSPEAAQAISDATKQK